VTLILETPDDPGGPLTVDADHPFEPIRTTAKFYRWPSEAREAFFAATARLHAKCVIADRSAALITSANLTSAGINDNLEPGDLIEAGPMPASLSRHLELLMGRSILELVRLSSRDRAVRLTADADGAASWSWLGYRHLPQEMDPDKAPP